MIGAFSITLICVFSSISPAQGQIPLLAAPESSENQSNLGWNINQMYDCGNILCSPVYLDGEFLFEVTSLPENQLNQGDQYLLSAEERAKNIQNTLYKIIESKRQYEIQQQSINSNYTAEPIATEVGSLFGQTVVFLPDQEGLVSRKIVTITELDARYAEKHIDEVSEEWKNILQQRLQIAISERQRLLKTPFEPIKYLLQRLLWIVFFSLSVYVIYRLLKAWDRKLRLSLLEFDSSLTFDAEAALSVSSDDLKSSSNSTDSSLGDSPLPDYLPLAFKSNMAWQVIWAQLNSSTTQIESIFQVLPQLMFQHRTFIKQQRNLVNLILQLLVALQFMIWSWGFASLVSVYPQSRMYQHFFIDLSFSLPLLWALIIILNKLCDFLIEWFLSRWARSASRLESGASSRYALRTNTYSTALTQLTTFIFMTVGLLTTLGLLGLSPTLLASFGVIAVALSWFSQNTVQDLLNGALILWNDRYAVGDVVDINGVGGLVEKLNLYMTQLRNLDGEAITIPNGSVDIVRNMTKDWSRVNFSVVIAYDADLNRAMEVIEATAAAMRTETLWKDVITDDLQMLGVDELSHQGVLIRALIRTQPIKQWDVAREFRRRLKLVFEKEGIGIGVPQQAVRFKDYSPLVSRGSQWVNK